jgi:hypothetical protein
MLIRAILVAAAACGVAVSLAVPAVAQQDRPPCDLALTFICNVIPMAPELDHNVDLTDQQPPADPNAPNPEMLPPLDPCSAGCI